MFTGLVEATGVLRRRAGKPVARALVETDLPALALGESISVNGVCLTVDRVVAGGFECDMSGETLERTTLGEIPLGARVHLERATPLGGRMGGHMVLGHVDGVGAVSAREPRGEALRFEVAVPAALGRFVAEKGSIAFDGVSLTLNRVGPLGAGSSMGLRPAEPGSAPYPGVVPCEVMLVPHTLARTTLGDLRVGARVNVEVDVLARYVARQLDFAHLGGSAGAAPASAPDPPEGAGASVDQRLLAKLGAGGYL
jgi:riboflavin synthase